MRSLFAPFERASSPYPLAVFRVLFYAGLLVHFAPSWLDYTANYGERALHQVAWDRALNLWLSSLPWAPPLLSVMAISGCGLGLAGCWPRLAAGLAGLGLYGLVNVSMTNTHTLALSYVWFVLWTWTISGGGGEVLSVSSSRAATRALPRPGQNVQVIGRTRVLFAAYLLLTLFCAGLEKIRAGWLHADPLRLLLQYPAHSVLRPWIVGLPEPLLTHAASAITWTTLAVELGVPIASLHRRTRTGAALVLAGFFCVIGVTMEVPLLFIAIQLGVSVLLLGDDVVRLGAGR